MLVEARQLALDPDKTDKYPIKIIEYHQHLLNSKAQLTGSVKGRSGGTTGKFKTKNISQLTVKTAVAVIQSFSAYHNLPLNIKRFKRKDQRLQRARPEKKKHQLTDPEIQTLFKLAGLRDKCVLALGLMGQDQSTIAGLKTGQFEGKLSGLDLESIELVARAKRKDP